MTEPDKEKLVNELFPAALSLLGEKSNDPLIIATASDVLTLVQVNNEDINIKDMKVLAAIEGFIEGAELVK